jgi:hypothetical protein
MNQALYAHMNNKRKMGKKNLQVKKKKKRIQGYRNVTFKKKLLLFAF